MKKFTGFIMLALLVGTICAQSDWLHIYRKDNKITSTPFRDLDSLYYLEKEKIVDTIIDDSTIHDSVIIDTTPADTVVIDTVIPNPSPVDPPSSDSGVADTLPGDTIVDDPIFGDSVVGDTVITDTIPMPEPQPKPEPEPEFDRMAVVSRGIETVLNLSDIDSIVSGTNIPTIYINTEGGLPIDSKKIFRNATIRIDGYAAYDDFEQMEVQVRGRGNSTWGYPKKPYRLKFSKKQSLLGMKKAKNYVLLANQIDNTMMRNAIAMEIGRRLGMPYVNSMLPVNLVLNGEYRGSYVLTEKVGFNSGSVNDIDEEKGIFFELDVSMDEDYKFYSKGYKLPVMVKDPDLDEIAESDPEGRDAATLFALWKEDFEELERLVMTTTAAPESTDPENPDPENPDPENPDPIDPDPENPNPIDPDPENPDPATPDPDVPDLGNPGNGDAEPIDPDVPETEQPGETIPDAGDSDDPAPDITQPADTTVNWSHKLDLRSVAKYLLVYHVLGNFEVNYPKSVYLYKADKDSVYHMGPLWDFDWATNFPEDEEWKHWKRRSFTTDQPGGAFFTRLLSDKVLMKAFVEEYENYKENIYPEILAFIDDYAEKIYISALQNGEIWPEAYYSYAKVESTSQLRENVDALKAWLKRRLDYIDSNPNLGLLTTDEPVIKPEEETPEIPGPENPDIPDPDNPDNPDPENPDPENPTPDNPDPENPDQDNTIDDSDSSGDIDISDNREKDPDGQENGDPSIEN